MDKRLSRGFAWTLQKAWHGRARRWIHFHDPETVSAVSLNGNRHVTGVLRGFDQFMNVVLDNTIDDKSKTDIGMVVSLSALLSILHAQEAVCL